MSTSMIRMKEAMVRAQEAAVISARNAIWSALMPSNPLVETFVPNTLCVTEPELDEQATKAVIAIHDLSKVLMRVENWHDGAVSDETVTIRVDALRAFMNGWTKHSYSEYEMAADSTRKLQQRVMDAEKRAKIAEAAANERAAAAEQRIADVEARLVKAQQDLEDADDLHDLNEADLKRRADELAAELVVANERATDAEQHIKAEEERFEESWLDWEDKKEQHKWDKSVLQRNIVKVEERAGSLERNLLAIVERFAPLDSLKKDVELTNDKWRTALDKKVEAETILAGLRVMGLAETDESMRVAKVIYNDAVIAEAVALENHTDAKNLIHLLSY